ncbi:toxin-antitoxin system YwqK family antitoxin [Prevotella sp.]|uniref:toxin-antitoxin system YwqK family antitoxin n=1 Tax=Prevotella sp. TaxID=59823 RepID=UPI002F95E397
MKKFLLLAVAVMVSLTSFGRQRLVSDNAKVVADTIFYADNMQNVVNRANASYYRLLKTQGQGLKKQEVFQDFYMNGTLKAEGSYSFIDLGNDANTVLNGKVTTYYKNGKERWHGTYVEGKRHGYFTLQMRDGGIAVVQFENGVSKFNYFTVTYTDGTTQKRSINELKSLL